MFKRSALSSAVAIVIAFSVQATVAQEADSSKFVEEELVVTGIRGSLTKALGIKRDKKQIIDVIVAEDIGKFPDNNVVEALQRVTGVQVTNRGAGEVNGVTIRGLGDISTTINGRQIFTSAGRSVQLADIPSGLLNRVDVYKTRSADKIEGGIAGQIDVLTHRPFNFDGSKVAFAARGIHQDSSGKTDPSVSALLSNRWNTDVGDFGALINVSYAKTTYRDQNIWSGIAFPYETENFTRISPSFYDENDINGLPTEAGSTIDVNGTPTEYAMIRDAVGFNDFSGERTRPAVNISLQWAPNESSEYLMEVFYNGYRNEDYRSLVHVFTDGASHFQNPEYFEGTNVVKRTFINDAGLFSSGDGFNGETDSYVYSIGGKWDIGSEFELASELIYQTSEFERSFFAMQTYTAPRDRLIVDFNDHDGIPSVEFLDNPDTAGIDEGDLTRVSDWTMGNVYDDVGLDEGDALTLSTDVDWTVQEGIIETLSFGFRYDQRNASSRSRLNEGTSCFDASVSDGVCRLSNFDGLVDVNRDDFFEGEASVPANWLSADAGYLLDNADMIRELYGMPLGGTDAVQERDFDIDETTLSAYVQADYGFYVAGRLLDGQVGVRVSRRSMNSSFDENSVSRLDESDSDTTVLPNIVARYALTDDLMMRASAGKTIRNPEFFDLNPTPNLNEASLSGSSGNPDLEPVESTNVDLSLEWYFAKSSSLYGVLFTRDVDGFIFIADNNVEVNDVQYVLEQPMNAGDGELNGVEIGFQYFPDNVPSWLQGFGVHASYTYIDGETEDPVYADDAQGVDVLIGYQTNPLVGVSENSYSVVLAYEKDMFDMRLSYVSRDDFLRGYNFAGGQPSALYSDSETSMDFQLSVEVTPELIVTFDATNLLDDVYSTYFDNENLYNADSALYSRTIALGARYSF